MLRWGRRRTGKLNDRCGGGWPLAIAGFCFPGELAAEPIELAAEPGELAAEPIELAAEAGVLAAEPGELSAEPPRPPTRRLGPY